MKKNAHQTVSSKHEYFYCCSSYFFIMILQLCSTGVESNEIS